MIPVNPIQTQRAPVLKKPGAYLVTSSGADYTAAKKQELINSLVDGFFFWVGLAVFLAIFVSIVLTIMKWVKENDSRF